MPCWCRIELDQILWSLLQQPLRICSGFIVYKLQCRGFVYAIIVATCKDSDLVYTWLWPGNRLRWHVEKRRASWNSLECESQAQKKTEADAARVLDTQNNGVGLCSFVRIETLLHTQWYPKSKQKPSGHAVIVFGDALLMQYRSEPNTAQPAPAAVSGIQWLLHAQAKVPWLCLCYHCRDLQRFGFCVYMIMARKQA